MRWHTGTGTGWLCCSQGPSMTLSPRPSAVSQHCSIHISLIKHQRALRFSTSPKLCCSAQSFDINLHPMCTGAWKLPVWWADSYTCQIPLFPCNPTPAELQDGISTCSMPSWNQLQCQHNNHAVVTPKKSALRAACDPSALHALVTGRARAEISFHVHGTALLEKCDGINLWRSCCRFLGGHIAEISLLKSQVSFRLHIFPNTSWSLSPSGFQWTLTKMNLASLI